MWKFSGVRNVSTHGLDGQMLCIYFGLHDLFCSSISYVHVLKLTHIIQLAQFQSYNLPLRQIVILLRGTKLQELIEVYSTKVLFSIGLQTSRINKSK